MLVGSISQAEGALSRTVLIVQFVWGLGRTTWPVLCVLYPWQKPVYNRFSQKKCGVLFPVSLCWNNRRQDFSLSSTVSHDNRLCVSHTFVWKEQWRTNVAALFSTWPNNSTVLQVWQNKWPNNISHYRRWNISISKHKQLQYPSPSWKRCDQPDQTKTINYPS